MIKIKIRHKDRELEIENDFKYTHPIDISHFVERIIREFVKEVENPKT